MRVIIQPEQGEAGQPQVFEGVGAGAVTVFVPGLVVGSQPRIQFALIGQPMLAYGIMRAGVMNAELLLQQLHQQATQQAAPPPVEPKNDRFKNLQ